MVKRLLIVEDDAPLRQMLTWELQELGYAVTAVGSCREALGLVPRQLFDLALLDYGLPDGNGVDLLEQLHRRLPELPVVMNSGHASDDIRQRALERGAVRFLSKPTPAGVLSQVLQNILNRRGQ